MTIAKSPAQVIAGEAVSGSSQERWDDMLNIASVMVNRAAMLGVSLEDVVSVQSQFNAYNKSLPAGTGSLVDMAQAALDQVATTGPVNNATYYSTPETADNLPNGLQPVAETTGHIFQADPAMRAIITAQGPIRPDPNALPSVASLDPLQQAIQAPYEANGLLNGVTSLTAAPATAVTSTSVPASALDPAFQPNGLLSGNFPASQFTAPSTAPMGVLATGDYATPNLSPSLNNFASLADAGPVGGQYADPNERMGLASADFDPSRFAGPTPSTALAQVMQTPSAYLDAPEPHPNINNFGLLAGAQPVQSPMGVQGVLGTMKQPNLAAASSVPFASLLFSPAVQNPAINNFADLAAAGPVASPIGVPASADVAAAPAYSAEATAVPSNTPATNSFSALADAGPFQSPSASQVSGISSPEMQAMQANVAQQLAASKPITASPTNNSFSDLAAAGALSDPVTATPTGILGTTPSLTASAVATPSNTGILSGYQEPAKVTPAETAISGILSQPSSLLSSTPLDTATPSLTSPTPTSSLLSGSMTPNLPQYQSFVPADVQPTTTTQPDDLGASYTSVSPADYKSLVEASFPSPPVNQTVAAPTDTTQSNVTIAGPTTTTATQQQQTSALNGAFPAAPTQTLTRTGLLSGMLNKGTLTGGILGSLVAGPAGGLVGGLLGNAINKNGGLTGLLSGSPMSINQIAGGVQNIGGIYGGSFAPGTQTTANNGDKVTSLGGGWTGVTGPNGVTTSFGPNGQVASYFGPSLSDTDHGVDTSGFSPGLW